MEQASYATRKGTNMQMDPRPYAKSAQTASRNFQAHISGTYTGCHATYRGLATLMAKLANIRFPDAKIQECTYPNVEHIHIPILLITGDSRWQDGELMSHAEASHKGNFVQVTRPLKTLGERTWYTQPCHVYRGKFILLKHHPTRPFPLPCTYTRARESFSLSPQASGFVMS